MGTYATQHVMENVVVPMRDGIGLAIDLYRPAAGGVVVDAPLPALLLRTPYDKRSPRFVDTARFFCAHGYVVGLQDVRGRYRSGGVFRKYQSEAADGHDTIAWLAALPYTDGHVGMWGTSYSAHVQADAAKLAPEGLRTLLINMGGLSHGWDHKIRNHGAFELLQQQSWAFAEAAAEAADPLTRDALTNTPLVEWFAAAPLREGLSPLVTAPEYENYLLEMARRDDYTHWSGIGTSWRDYYAQTADIPMLLISGWYDSYAGGTIENYSALATAKDGPVRLIMGPWTHGGNLHTHAGDVEFGPAAALDGFEREFSLAWFDAHLKGVPNHAAAGPAVKVFIMGTGDGHCDPHGRLYHGGYWREGERWPLPGTTFTDLFFHGDGGLRGDPPGEQPASTTYRYDPHTPVPTIGGAFSAPVPGKLIPSGAFHQRERPDRYGSLPPYLPLKSRHDVLVFQTAPLAEEVTIVGPIVVQLYISSSAPDTDFTVKLIDVYPPSVAFPGGFEMNLTDGILRARFRDPSRQPALLTPGEIYPLTIEPFPTANVFKAGHRIRVDISSSNFPRFDLNPNTGNHDEADRRRVVADNTIFHCPSYPSHVVLPVLSGRVAASAPREE